MVHVSRLLLLIGVTLAALSGCRTQAQPVDLPRPIEATSVGVGDVISVFIVREEKLPTEFKVAADGTIDVPYIQRVEVAGLEPQEITDLIRQRLIAGEILTNPSVSVMVKEYNSKRVAVLGEIKKPGSLQLEPGMTLLRAISQAGGFSTLADRSRVTIRRKVKGGTKAAMVDVTAIIDNRIPDVPLQAGDSIFVDQRVF